MIIYEHFLEMCFFVLHAYDAHMWACKHMSSHMSMFPNEMVVNAPSGVRVIGVDNFTRCRSRHHEVERPPRATRLDDLRWRSALRQHPAEWPQRWPPWPPSTQRQSGKWPWHPPTPQQQSSSPLKSHHSVKDRYDSDDNRHGAVFWWEMLDGDSSHLILHYLVRS